MNITFSNFKSFPNLKNGKKHRLDFGRINLLYGFNNSGKSSILQLLKLFSKNYNDLSELKTNYEDFSLGSYKNIINNKSKDFDFDIEFFQSFIPENILNAGGNSFSFPSINFKYKSNATEKNSSGILNSFQIIFPNNKSLDYFEFEKWHKYYLCENVKIAENSSLFNFDKLDANIRDHKIEIDKMARTALASYNNTLKNIIDTVSHLNSLKDLVSKSEPDIKQTLKYLFEKCLLSDFFEKLVSKNKRKHGSFRAPKKLLEENPQILKTFLRDGKGSYVYEEDTEAMLDLYNDKNFTKKINILIQELELINTILFEYTDETRRNLIENDRDETQLTSGEMIFDLDLNNRLAKDIKYAKKFANKINKITNSIQEIASYDLNFEINQFYRNIGKAPDKNKPFLFLGFSRTVFDKLIDYCSNKNKDSGAIQLRDVFCLSLANSLYMEELSENSEIEGIENNILQIMNRLPIRSKALGVLTSFEELKLIINQFTILRPLLDVVNIKNDNCFLNQRFYEVKDFETDNFTNRYNQKNVVNDIYRNQSLLVKINNNLNELGFDINLGFEQNNIEIIEPILFKKDNKKLVSKLADSGHAIRKLIPLIYHICKNQDGVITIEEPEANIHPRYQGNLANLFVNNLIENNNEFVIETHSEIMVLRFLKLIREKKLRFEDFSIHFIESNDSESTITKIEINEDGSLGTSWPGGFFKERIGEFL